MAAARAPRPGLAISVLLFSLILGVLGMHALSRSEASSDTRVATVASAAPDDLPPAHAEVGAGHHTTGHGTGPGSGVMMLCGAMLLALAVAGLHRRPISRHVKRATIRGAAHSLLPTVFVRTPDPPSLAGLCLLRC